MRKTIISLAAAAVFITSAANAAPSSKIPKPKTYKVDPKLVFMLPDAKSVNIRCFQLKGKYVSGVLKKNVFTPIGSEIDVLKAKIKKEKKKSALTKLKSSLKKLQKKQKTEAAICAQGPDPLDELRRPLTEADIRYLYDKAAFGAVTPEAINIGLTQGVSALVDHMMGVESNPALENDGMKYLDENFQTDSTNVTQRGVQLWSLYLMLNGNKPFNERFAFLFMHNLLATSMEVLTDGSQMPLMVDHLNRIRAGAHNGDYPALVKDITRDPVMLIWLNGNQNTKQQPNENFARELMELFTMGPTDRSGNANYSETTVAQVARACTGWTVQRLDAGDTDIWSAVFGQAIHDPDPNKTVFEGTPFQGNVENDESLINHIFSKHGAVDDYLAFRLANEYLNETPSTRALDSLAKFVKSSNFNLRSSLARLLKSEEFYKSENRNTVVASPVDRMVRFLRMTKIPYRIGDIQRILESSGQVIGMPPTVFGWDNDEWPEGQWLLSLANGLTSTIRNDSYFAQPAINFSFTSFLPSPTASAQEVIRAVAAKLNVTLTADQENALVTYMNNRMGNNNTLIPDAWNPGSAAVVRRKVAGLLEILTRSNDFQMR